MFGDTSDTQASMMNQYIKDVSSTLVQISAVWEKRFELHLAAEWKLLPKYFYLTFQHVNFSKIKYCNENVWNNLRERFEGSLTGQPYSTTNRDFIAAEVQTRGGPIIEEYSTLDKTLDAGQSWRSQLICFHHAFIRSYHQDQENIMTAWLQISKKKLEYCDPFLIVPVHLL